MPVAKRPYRQIARAAASQDLRLRILKAFHDLLLERWIDEITLDAVASAAGTTRRTVIRLFGGKEGALEEVIGLVWAKAAPRLALPRDASRKATLDALMAHYEAVGDVTVRLLAQEERHPALRPALDLGRRNHRAWIAERLGPAPDGGSRRERERQITSLVVATDVYTWKLLRRDFGNSREEVATLIAGMVGSIRGETLK